MSSSATETESARPRRLFPKVEHVPKEADLVVRVCKMTISTYKPHQALAKTINPAMRGDPFAVGILRHAIDLPNFSTLTNEILDVWFAQANPKLIPSYDDIDLGLIPALASTACCLESLRGIIQFMSRDVSKKPKSAPRKKDESPTPTLAHRRHVRTHLLNGAITNVPIWIVWLLERSPATYLNHGTATMTSSDVFLIAITFLECLLESKDPEVVTALETSREIAHLLCRLWLLKNKEIDYASPCRQLQPDEYFILTYSDELAQCPLVNIMSNLILRPRMTKTCLENWWSFLQDVGIHGKKMDPGVLMARTILSRVSQIQYASENDLCASEVASTNLHHLGNLLLAIVRHGDGSKKNPTYWSLESRTKESVHRALEKEDYLRKWVKCLLSLSDRAVLEEAAAGFPVPDPEGILRIPVNCLRFCNNGLWFPIQYRSSIVQDIRDLIRGGLLQLAANCCILLQHYPQSYLEASHDNLFSGLASDLVKSVVVYSALPPVMKEVVEVMNPDGKRSLTKEQTIALSWAIEDAHGEEPTRTDGAPVNWVAQFASRVNELNGDYKAANFPKVCDSARHRESPQWGVTNEQHVCAGCRTTMYCSEWCQTEDWHSRHRWECHNHRLYRKQAKTNGDWYNPAWRNWHISRLTTMYFQTGGKGHISHPPSSIARTDGFGLGTPFNYILHHEYDYHNLTSNSVYGLTSDHSDCDAFQGRFEEFLEWARVLPAYDCVKEVMVNFMNTVSPPSTKAEVVVVEEGEEKEKEGGKKEGVEGESEDEDEDGTPVNVQEEPSETEVTETPETSPEPEFVTALPNEGPSFVKPNGVDPLATPTATAGQSVPPPTKDTTTQPTEDQSPPATEDSPSSTTPQATSTPNSTDEPIPHFQPHPDGSHTTTTTRPVQATIGRRLVEGVFQFGERIFVLTVKYRVTYAESLKQVIDVDVLDSIVRVGPIPVRARGGRDSRFQSL